MTLALKLVLFGAIALTAAASTAPAVAASIEVRTEPGGEPCPPVTLVSHDVQGGCHTEIESTGEDATLHAMTAMGKVTISNCEVRAEARLDEHGEGYVNNAILAAPHAGAVPCTRRPCDENAGATDADLPWPTHMEEQGAGHEEIEIAFCLVPILANEGTAGTWCEIHLRFAALGNHLYGNGGEGQFEVFCENNPPNPEGNHPTLPTVLSLEKQLVSTGPTTLEVVH